MIPVEPQPEPEEFDTCIRQKGLQWLAKKGIDTTASAPDGFKFTPLWRECLDAIYERYARICAYGGFYIERVTGAPTVEHFVPKSKAPGLAYEWGNYRMVCSLLNGRKRHYEDVLDPFTLPPETFHLNLVTGAILPNPSLEGAALDAAEATIRRLKLDDAACRNRRMEDFDQFRSLRDEAPAEYLSEYLKRRSPFVWYEARRQDLL